jgi:hypothetical protein
MRSILWYGSSHSVLKESMRPFALGASEDVSLGYYLLSSIWHTRVVECEWTHGVGAALHAGRLQMTSRDGWVSKTIYVRPDLKIGGRIKEQRAKSKEQEQRL